MKDQSKTKQELIKELASLRQKNAELEREELQGKKTEKTLRESEEYFRSLIEKSPDAHLMIDDGDCYIDCNPAALDMLRMASRDQLLGLTPADLSPERQPDGRLSREKAQTMIAEIKAKGNHRFEWVHRRADGEEFPAEVLANVLQYHGKALLHAVWHDISERKRAEEEHGESLEDLKKAFEKIIRVISSILEKRDPYTAGHQRRVADLARAIGEEMGLSRERVVGLHMTGSIHDIGKISIPAEILSKPTQLTEIEYKFIQSHSQTGYDILQGIEFPWPIAEIILQHHERTNGSGYPRGLKGEEILLEAAIMCVSDVVEAMASDRPYRAAMGIEAALEEIENNKGVFYDFNVVNVCLKLFREKGYRWVG